ncbi:MAG: hypothetical protein ACLRZG_08400 [Streptococcus sp.]
MQRQQVSTLSIGCFFLLSMVAQPFFGYINERFGIVKMTTLSLSVIIGGVFGFLWAPNLFWLTVFYGIVLVCLNGTAPMMEVFATQSPCALQEDSAFGEPAWLLGRCPNSRLGLSSSLAPKLSVMRF